MRSLRGVCLLLVFLAPGLSPCQAWTPGTFSIQDDNDVFALSDRSDRGYTNGTRFIWTWSPEERSHIGAIANRLCGSASTSDCERSASFVLGQNMYTPENLRVPTRTRGDRPYGGWLYSALMFDIAKEEAADHLEVYLGVVGRPSHAAEAQKFAHRAIIPSAPEPQGWDTQVGDFLGVQVAYERRQKFQEWVDSKGRPFLDLTPSVGATIGNVFAHFAAGATMRIGYNLPSRFSRPILSIASVEPTAAEGTPLPSRWDAYLFATADARYVARDIFIDAGEQDCDIKRKPFVRDRRVGASVRFRWLRIEYAHTRRSPEFDPDSRSHSFGTYTLSVGTRP